MRRLLTACVLVLGIIFVYGLARGDGRDRLKLSKIDEKRGITLVVSMSDATSRYEVLHVQGCAAEVTETGVFCIPEGWSSRSDRSIFRNQESIPVPDCPRGTVKFDAYAVDRDGHVLAAGSVTWMRGW